jgi:hypothetical protein
VKEKGRSRKESRKIKLKGKTADGGKIEGKSVWMIDCRKWKNIIFGRGGGEG